jgi:hypothetical protein
MPISFNAMSDENLDKEIMKIYAEEAERFDSTVEEIFDMEALRAWFRAGFPCKVEGMSTGMVKLAAIPLIEQGILTKQVEA